MSGVAAPNISIHALREERDESVHAMLHVPYYISIHALREERDRSAGMAQSNTTGISIHALREERDVNHSHAVTP